VRIIRTSADLDAVVTAEERGPGLVLLMEGADPIRSPQDLGWFVEQGVRIIGLAWGATRYSGGSHAPGPLTPLGCELLKEMAKSGAVLDTSHMSEEAFWQAMDVFDGQVIASHSNCRAIVPGERQISDDMIRAIAERGGMIGLVLYNAFIRPDWRDGDPRSEVTLADLLPHFEHIADLAGVDHIGLGTDLDGAGGLEVTPKEIDTAADLPRLAQVLRAAGYDEGTVTGIMGGNWHRMLRRMLG
jgi:membrane dipeptidase